MSWDVDSDGDEMDVEAIEEYTRNVAKAAQEHAEANHPLTVDLMEWR